MTLTEKRGRLVSAALVLVLVAGLVWLWIDRDRVGAVHDAENPALGAARTAAVDLTTYDYRTLAADHARVEAEGTAAFRDYFKAVEKDSTAVVTDLQSTSVGEIVEAVAQASDADHVSVLVLVRQTTSSGKTATRLTSPVVLKLAMLRADSRWLVDQLQSLPVS